MKQFFRFWFTPGLHSQHQYMFAYASDLASASVKVSDRLDRDYKGRATLTGRVEQFSLEDANKNVRPGHNLAQSLTPADVFEVCEDARQLPADAWTPTEKRTIRELNEQEICVRAGRGTPRPLNLPPQPRRERVLGR